MHLPAKKTQIEQLNDGLLAAQAGEPIEQTGEDGLPDFVVPAEIKAEFARFSVGEIDQKIVETEALCVAAPISLGFWYMAKKTKLPKRFRQTLIDEGGPGKYLRAHRAMCRARAWMVIPEVAEWLGVEPIRKLLTLTAADIQDIRTKLIGVPPELTRTLSEKEIDRAYYRIQKQKQTGKHAKKKVDLPPENTDTQWANVKGRWAEAVVAMEKLVGACRLVKEWKTEYVDEALEKKMVVKLSAPCDDVVKFLHPIEEIRRRGMCED